MYKVELVKNVGSPTLFVIQQSGLYDQLDTSELRQKSDQDRVPLSSLQVRPSTSLSVSFPSYSCILFSSIYKLII